MFLPLLAWLISTGEQIDLYISWIAGLTGNEIEIAREGGTRLLLGAVAALGLFVSVALHELGHSWMALRYDIEIESITLWILGGIAGLKEIPREWEKEFWIAVAGPAVSVALAAICYAAAVATPETMTLPVFLFGWLAITNIALTIFNMVPAFPMDGGRVLRSLLARKGDYGAATVTAARVGIVFAVAFAALGVLAFNIILMLVAMFIYVAAKTESNLVKIDDLLHGLTIDDIMDTDLRTIQADTPLSELGDRMIKDKATATLSKKTAKSSESSPSPI